MERQSSLGFTASALQEKEPIDLDATVWSFLDGDEDHETEPDDLTCSNVPSSWHSRQHSFSPFTHTAPQMKYAEHVFPIAQLVPWINGALAKNSGCVAFLCGATCSGKTTSAQLTAQHFKAQAFVVSSDLQCGMGAKSPQDVLSASLAQYLSQLERARKEPIAILLDGCHLQAQDIKEKLYLAFHACVPLEHVGWFVADQRLNEEDEVKMLMKRQQQRFARYWNTGDSSVQQGDAKIIPVEQVRAMVRKLRKTFLKEDMSLVDWDGSKVLDMISNVDPSRVLKPKPFEAAPSAVAGVAPFLVRPGWPTKEMVFTEVPAPTGMEPAIWVTRRPSPPPPYSMPPYAAALTLEGYSAMDATMRLESTPSSSAVGLSPGPSLDPSLAPSPHSQGTSPTISPTTFGLKQTPTYLPAVPDPLAPSLSHILKANAIHSTRPLTPPRAAQPAPSPVTLSAVAAIVSTLHQTLNLKNAQAATGTSIPPSLTTGPHAVAKPAPLTRASPSKGPAAVHSLDLRRNSAPALSYPAPPDGPGGEWELPREMQGVLPTPPQVVLRPEVYGVTTAQEGTAQADTLSASRPRGPKKGTPQPPSPSPDPGPRKPKLNRRHSTSRYLP